MKVTNYTIVQARDLHPLESQVQTLTRYGWVPHGSLVAVTQSPGNTLFCQPMIKTENEDA